MPARIIILGAHSYRRRGGGERAAKIFGALELMCVNQLAVAREKKVASIAAKACHLFT